MLPISRRYTFFSILLILPMILVRGQEVELSQFFAAPLHLNPAMAGISYGPRAIVNYRNQWPSLGSGFQGGFATYMASADVQVQPMRGGFGLQFVGDQIAGNLMGSYKISLMYAQQIRFNRKAAMRIGLSGYWVHTRIRWNELQFSDMIDPYTGFYNTSGGLNPSAEASPGVTSSNRGDVAAGILFFGPKWYTGFAAHNLIRHPESLQNRNDAATPFRFVLQAGGDITIKHRMQGKYNISLAPHVVAINQGTYFQAQGALLANISFMYFGVGYRHALKNNDAVIGHLGFRKWKFRLGYSYDYTISSLINRSGGSHEISLTFNLPGLDDNALNPKAMKGYIPCPDILNF